MSEGNEERLSPGTRVAMAGVLWAVIYFCGLYVIPTTAPVRALREAWPWLGSGDVTQFIYLVSSLAAIWIIGRGDWRSFGFRGVRATALIKPILITAVLSSVLFFAGIIAMVLIEGPPDKGAGPGGAGSSMMSRGFLSWVISIWIVASTCEEIFFRGLLQTLLAPLRKYGVGFLKIRLTAPVVICALAFGLGHLCLMRMFGGVFLVEIVVSCTVMGLVAGYYREKTGSLAPAIAAHVTANVVGFVIPQILMRVANTQGA